jgi:AcrR family transcriptional regulator
VRRRLIDEGGSQVKERGVQGASVHSIARAVGLSGPALYSHFNSKNDLLRVLVSEELGATARDFLAEQPSFQEVLGRYLSLRHAREAASGCALPAITADVARSDAEVRGAYQDSFLGIVQALVERLGDREAALGILAASVGAVSLARALPDDALATEVLAATQGLIEQVLASTPLEP